MGYPTKYYYYALLTPDPDGGYTVEFPDVRGAITHGDTVPEALEKAKDALAIVLAYMEEQKEAIPAPSEYGQIAREDGQLVQLVDVFMPPYRKDETKAVRKTVTMPKWLRDAGEEKDLNFSAILQEALKEALGLDK